MRWILVAVLLALIACCQARPTKHDHAKLIQELEQLIRRVERMETGLASPGADVGNAENTPQVLPASPQSASPQSASPQLEFMQLVNLTISSIAEADVLLSKLSVDQISKAVQVVTNNLLARILNNPNCRQFVIAELFLGSLKHGLQFEMIPMNPNSLYSVVTAWSPTALAQDSKMAAILATFQLAISEIDALSTSLGVLNEDDFFNALDDQRADCNQQNGELVNGVPMSSPGPCNDLTTMTLRDVLMQNIFSHATVLHVPEDAKCEENVGLSLQLHTLAKNITNLISSGLKSFGSSLSENDAELLHQFIEENYNSDVVDFIAEIAETMDELSFDKFELEFAEHFIGQFLGLQIKEEEENLEVDEIVDHIRNIYPNLSETTGSLSSSDRLGLIANITLRIIDLVAPTCPEVVITKLILGFASYEMPLFEDVETIVLDIASDMDVTRTIKSIQKAHVLTRLQKLQVKQLARQSTTELGSASSQQYGNIRHVVDAIPDVIKHRMELVIKPILDTIEGRSAEWIFSEIISMLTIFDPTNVPFDELTKLVLEELLPFINLNQGCPVNVDLFAMLHDAFQDLASKGPITSAEIELAYMDSDYTPSAEAVENIPRILATFQNQTEVISDKIQEFQLLAEFVIQTDVNDIKQQTASIIAALLDELIEDAMVQNVPAVSAIEHARGIRSTVEENKDDLVAQ